MVAIQLVSQSAISRSISRKLVVYTAKPTDKLPVDLFVHQKFEETVRVFHSIGKYKISHQT